MSLMAPSAGGLQLLTRTLGGRQGTITAATNASPSVLTSSPPPDNGSSITISGGLGNTAINVTGTVYNLSGNNFSLTQVNTTTGAATPVNGNGVLTNTPTWTLAGLESCNVKLYSNNITPAESDSASTYTELANGNGYTTGGIVFQSLFAAPSGNVWTIPATVGGGGTGSWASSVGSGSTNVPESTGTPVAWNFTGPATSYGLFVVGSVSGLIWWAERWATAPNSYSNGSVQNLTLRFGGTHS